MRVRTVRRGGPARHIAAAGGGGGRLCDARLATRVRRALGRRGVRRRRSDKGVLVFLAVAGVLETYEEWDVVTRY